MNQGTYSISTSMDWQSFWGQTEKGINSARRRICFERASFIASHPILQEMNSPIIYDLGSGYAEVSKHLLLELEGARLVAVDWSAEALAVARRRLSVFSDRIDIIQADCCCDEGFFDQNQGKADIVLSLGVIEHFHDPETVLRNTCKVLAPNGVIVLMVPNSYSCAPFCRKIMEKNGSWKFGYQREYSTKTLRQWCVEAGLEIISEHVLQRYHSPTGEALLNAFSAVDRLIAKFSQNWGFYSYIFAKKTGV